MTDGDRGIVFGGPADGARRLGAWDRRGAALYDLLVGSWAVGVFTAGLTLAGVLPQPLGAATGLVALWLVLVAVEGTTGSSPGKHVVGAVVLHEGRQQVGVAVAARRRPWVLPLLVVPLGGTVASAGVLGWLVVLISMAVSAERAPDGRGWHDRLAATTVIDAPLSPRSRLVVVAVTIALTIAGTLLAGLGEGAAVA